MSYFLRQVEYKMRLIIKTLLVLLTSLAISAFADGNFFEINQKLVYAQWDYPPQSPELEQELLMPFPTEPDGYYVNELPNNCFDLASTDIYAPETIAIYAPSDSSIPIEDAIKVVRAQQVECWAKMRYFSSDLPSANYLGLDPLSQVNMREWSNWVEDISAFYDTDAFRHVSDIPNLDIYSCVNMIECRDDGLEKGTVLENGVVLTLHAVSDVNGDGVSDAILSTTGVNDGKGGYRTAVVLTRRASNSTIEALEYFPDRKRINERIHKFSKH